MPFQDSSEVSKYVHSLPLYPASEVGNRRILFAEEVIREALENIELKQFEYPDIKD